MPLLYVIDEVARRYGVFPASIDFTIPEHMTWFRRALIFMAMENDRDVAIVKRQQQQQRRR